MSETTRRGPLGALMDEYERAIKELGRVLNNLSDEEYAYVFNPDSEDPRLTSIQGILWHVIAAGYGYAAKMREALKIEVNRPPRRDYSRAEAIAELPNVIAYTDATLDGRWHLKDEELGAILVPTTWSDRYDIEMLLEHAIVHILRHRRQIERAGHLAKRPS